MSPRDRAIQVARAAGFLGVTAAMVPAFVAARKMATARDERTIRDVWVRRWSTSLLQLFSIRVRVEGTVPERTEGRGRLVVSNHRSGIDIGVVLQRFGGVMVSRGDLSRWPFIGPAARSVGTIFVDRDDVKSGASSVRAMRNALDGGDSVDVFPEGTTFDGDEVRPFHRGAFVAAARTGAEILPIGLAYARGAAAAFTNETFPAHLARMAAATTPTRVVLVIGAPFIPGADARAVRIAERARVEVQALVTRAREIVDR